MPRRLGRHRGEDGLGAAGPAPHAEAQLGQLERVQKAIKKAEDAIALIMSRVNKIDTVTAAMAPRVSSVTPQAGRLSTKLIAAADSTGRTRGSRQETSDLIGKHKQPRSRPCCSNGWTNPVSQSNGQQFKARKGTDSIGRQLAQRGLQSG